MLDVPPPINNDSYPILREEVEAAVKSLKKGKSAGVDNIPSKLVQAGGEAMIDMLLIICNMIWQTGERPTSWTHNGGFHKVLFLPDPTQHLTNCNGRPEI